MVLRVLREWCTMKLHFHLWNLSSRAIMAPFLHMDRPGAAKHIRCLGIFLGVLRQWALFLMLLSRFMAQSMT
jgi:hypothetical protein